MVLVLPVAGLSACSSGGQTASHSSDTGKASRSASSDAGAVPGTVDDHKTVAVVNGHKITGAVYNRMLTQVHTQDQQTQMQQMQQGQAAPSPSAKQEKKQAIDTVVGTALLSQDADAHGYTAPKKTVDQQIGQVTKQYPTKKKLKQALGQNHITMGELRTEISDQVKITAYIKKELGPFTATNKQISAYYAKLKKLSGKSDQGSVPPLKKVKSQIKQRLESQTEQQKVTARVSALKKHGKVNVLI